MMGRYLLIFLLCSLTSVSAQVDDLQTDFMRFSHLDVSEGLSQSSVLSIHQDRYGFLWFGTRDGLNRYDGYGFEIYRYSIDDPTSLGGNSVNDIKEDSQGNLYLSTENGLSFYNRNQNRFKNYTHFDQDTAIGQINEILVDREDRVWLAGNFGLYQFFPDSDKFNHHIGVNKILSQDVKLNINALAEDDDGNLWIGTIGFGLYKLHKNRVNVERVNLKTTSQFTSRVEVIAFDNEKGIWIGTYGDGLFYFSEESGISHRFHTNAFDDEKRINNNVRTLLLDDDGNLWVGTFGGLFILKDGLNANAVPFGKARPWELTHNSIRALFLDDKNSVWIGTYFGGVNNYDKDNQRFTHFLHSVSDPNSLSFNVVGAIAESRQGEFFIGTERGGVNRVLGYGKSHQVLDSLRFGDSTIKALYVDKDETCWIGVFKEGLFQYNEEEGQMNRLGNNISGSFDLTNAIINSIKEDRLGKIWVATDAMGGLHCLDLSKQRYIDFPFANTLWSKIGYHSVKDILINPDQTFELATKGLGIVQFNPINGNVVSMTSFTTNKGTVPIDQFNSLMTDDRGTKWYASDGAGLLVKEPTSDTYIHLGVTDGLSSDVVYGCLQSSNGSIWAITLNGISKIDIQNRTIAKSYTNQSGFPLGETNEGAFFRTQDGQFVIGGNNGYVRFDPDRLTDNSYVPKMAFTGLKVMNKETLPGDDLGLLDRSINKTDEITLNYDQSVFTVEFAALSFLKPENNRYQYKLLGFDEEWVDAGNSHSVTYTNLPHGSYKLFVKGSNNDGIWNEAPISMGITILPPPWKTWWAYTLYALIVLGTLLVIRYYTLRSIRLEQSLRIEQLEKDKWREIHDLKLKYFIDVSHEFRTPLTLIINPLEELMAYNFKAMEVKQLLRTMYSNGRRLLLLINQILEIREIETGHLKLQLESIHLDRYIKEIFDGFKALADKNNIKLTYIQDTFADSPVSCDKDKLDKIFYNLISNAFKFTPKGGEIILKVKAENQMDDIAYHFMLKDTGVGISKNNLPYVFDRFFKTTSQTSGAGIGLSLTKSLVELMEGKISVESEEDIGTTFFLELTLAKVQSGLDLKPSDGYRLSLPMELDFLDEGSEETFDTESNKPLILIVEDNDQMRKYLKNKLSKGYRTLSAENGFKGLTLAEKHGPDLIISDIMMPEMDGLELCKKIKESKFLSHIPVLLLTAKNAHVNKIEGLEHGADEYISKPFNLKELKLRVKNILNNRLALQERIRSLSTPLLSDERMLHPYDEKLMKSIISKIQEHLDQPNFTVEALGQEVGLSRVHLFRKLKSLTGKSPSEFIKEIRMQNAIELLETNAYRISEVAEMVGYQDVKYFSKCFKATMGKSPSQYVEKQTT